MISYVTFLPFGHIDNNAPLTSPTVSDGLHSNITFTPSLFAKINLSVILFGSYTYGPGCCLEGVDAAGTLLGDGGEDGVESVRELDVLVVSTVSTPFLFSIGLSCGTSAGLPSASASASAVKDCGGCGSLIFNV